MTKDHTEAVMNLAGKLARGFLTSKLTTLFILAVTLTGLLALVVTPREYNPQIIVPAANIIVPKPGASATEIHNLIVKPLEAIMNAQSGVDHTFGYATNDFGLVTVQFKVGENQEDSLVKMYNQLMQNWDRIPPGAMEPIIKPINVDDVPIMTLTLTSATHDDLLLRQVGQRVLENLRNVQGVSFTQIIGGHPHALNIWIDPQRLEAAGVTLDRIHEMMSATNVAAPLGELIQANESVPLRLACFLCSAERIGKIVIGATPAGGPIYLKDVARIEEGAAEIEESSRFAFGPANAVKSAGENPAVTLAIAKKAGTNAVVVANAVLSKLEELKLQAIPAGIEVAVTRNDGAKADAAVNELVMHLGIAIASVVLILVVFLGWREAGIVTMTVPLILFVVLAVGLAFGQTINRITLFALILSLGLLVDAAIVVIENIHRHLHDGSNKPFSEVLIIATNEIGNPTNIATIAVILAFIPMAFVGGMMGPFMLPIPFNVPVAMIASIVIAYMVVPWASNLWLAKAESARQRALTQPSMVVVGAASKDPLHQFYVGVLSPLIKSATKRNLTFVVVLALLAGAMLMPAWQFIRPSGLNGPLSPLGVELKMLPNDNTNTMLLQIDLPAGSALAATDQVARAAGAVIGGHPHVTDYQTFLGMTAPIDFAALVRGDMIKRGGNLAQIRVNFIDKHLRNDTSHDIALQLDRSLLSIRKQFPAARIKLFETPPGPPVQAQILAELYGPDYDLLRGAAPAVNQAFEQIFGMINVDNSVTADSDTYRVVVDHEKAMLAGIPGGQVAKVLRDYVSGFNAGIMHLESAREPIDIHVRLPRELRANPESLMNLSLTNPHGMQIPLAAIASIKRIKLAKPIYARDQHPMVMVGGELLQSSPVYAVLALDEMLDGKTLPNGVKFHTGNLGFTQASPKDVVENTLLWGGEMRLTLDVFRDLGSAFIVALILIYLVLVAYYKSFGLPLIVMGAIPLTLIGVFPGHWATSQAFTATSMIGVIALAGIVVRNSLLLIDFILDYRKQGYGLEQSVIEAGAVRFRPILLTALAIILGSAIMITDPVFGGLAVSLIFGTFASTALTLVVIPLMYYLWQRKA